MKNFKSNLKARKITMSNEDIYMVQRISLRKLQGNTLYTQLPSSVKDIIENNVLIAAATDNMKHTSKKADIMIGNLDDAIKLVFKDMSEGSANILEA